MSSSPVKFQRLQQVVEQSMERREQLGFQIYISLNSQTQLDIAFGKNKPDQRLAPSTRMLWLSAGKPVTAVAVMQCVERGEIQLDEPVSRYIPEFNAAGTEAITIRRLLNHTAGLKPVLTGYPEASWEAIIRKICQSGVSRNSAPGAEVAYDPGRSWFLLAEVLCRLDGQRPIEQILREDVLEPIGMKNSWLALPEDVYDAQPDKIGVSYTVKDGEFQATLGSRRDHATKPSPGASMRGPIRELGLFYEMLLANGRANDQTLILRPETVTLMRSRQRENQFDHAFQRTIDFGLGLIINSQRYDPRPPPYGFGAHASAETFGHGGNQCAIGFADPVHQVVVAAIANGLPGDEIHNQRFFELCTAIYEDLGLAQN